MNRADSKLWASARTLDDLCELTAMWLEGAIRSHPGYGGRPDPETTELVRVLVAMNRSGLLTLNSQPRAREPITKPLKGWMPYESATWCQDAEVTFLADHRAWRKLSETLPDDLIMQASRPSADYRSRARTCVSWTETEHQIEEFTWSGHSIAKGDLFCILDGCHRDAQRAAWETWQISLIEPQYLGTGSLWPFLAAYSGLAVTA